MPADTGPDPPSAKQRIDSATILVTKLKAQDDKKSEPKRPKASTKTSDRAKAATASEAAHASCWGYLMTSRTSPTSVHIKKR